LDIGELAAIRLALALRCPILMDERLGRQAAQRQGLTVIGSAGLLIAAKQRGLIPAVPAILDQSRRSDYFLSAALVQAVLKRAGEA
jgi:predicted nucleic acid-binding protein